MAQQRGYWPPVASDTLETGEEAVLRSFESYPAAEAVVDTLGDRGLPLQKVRIVARDLIFVERPVGRVTFGRALTDGAWSGAFVGALIGFFFGIFDWFAPVRSALVLAFWGVVLGGVLGAVVAAAGYWNVGSRRDYASVGSIEAGRYDVVVDRSHADEARRLLVAPS